MDTRLLSLLTNHLWPDSERTARRRANLVIQNKSKMTLFSLVWMVAFVLQMTMLGMPRARAASDLKLAPKLSFDVDSIPNFPIQGKNLSECSLASAYDTMIFLYTSTSFTPPRY